MNNELKQELRATVGAAIPALAIHSPETEQIIKDVLQYSYSTGSDSQTGTVARVLVWRVGVGFEEWAAYKDVGQNEDERIMTCLTENTASVDYRRTGVVERSEDDFPGAQVPFAVDFMTNYDAEADGHRVIFVLRDWNEFIAASGNEHIDRQLMLLEQAIEGNQKTVVMLSPSRWTEEDIPDQLKAYIRLTNYPLPDKVGRMLQIRQELGNYVRDTNLPNSFRENMLKIGEEEIEQLSDACAGMTRLQIQDTLTMSAALHRDWKISFVLDEKRKAVERAGFTLIRPATGFENIGGLTPLKRWIHLISRRFTQAAKEYGFIRNIRGLLMAGVPGCGKTAVAKAMANEMNMNILMVEAPNLKGSLVGESEAKVQRLLDIAKAAAPLIVFVDEAEKLLGKSEGVHDGGAHDAVLGQFLTFMQEDDSGVMFVFTANNMNKFSPELVDRFEGRFFIDLPEPEEREEIIKIHLRLRSQDVDKYDVSEVVKKTAKFSGRNIEDGIEEAMTISFSEERPLEMRDLIEVFDVLVPTSKTKKDEIEHMRSFVENGTMRKANNEVVRDSKSKKTRLSNLREFYLGDALRSPY